MDVARLYGTAEIVVPILVFLAISLNKFQRGMRDTWREEAEAQKVRADRLDEEVSRLGAEIAELRRENAELRAQVTQLLARG